jgi:hypothetical protein
MGSSGSLCEQSTVVERVRGVLEHLGGGPRGRSAAWEESLPVAASTVRQDLAAIGARLARLRAERPDLMPVEEGPLLGKAREVYGDLERSRYAGFPRMLPRE